MLLRGGVWCGSAGHLVCGWLAGRLASAIRMAAGFSLARLRTVVCVRLVAPNLIIHLMCMFCKCFRKSNGYRWSPDRDSNYLLIFHKKLESIIPPRITITTINVVFPKSWNRLPRSGS